MKEPFIFLSSEISRENAVTLIEWLKDEEVTRYLSDSQNVSDDIEYVINQVDLPVLTHLFNQNGRFFMAYSRRGEPLGFVRLIKRGINYEIVIVIGDRENWNKKWGTSVIRESIKMAFFEFRAEKVTAKIYSENKGSIHAFTNAGFKLERETPDLKIYSLTLDHYLELLKEKSAVPSDIYITKLDRDRIHRMLVKLSSEKQKSGASVKKLEGELDRAVIVDSDQVSQDVITMNSKALLEFNHRNIAVSLVYPKDANPQAMKLSIFSPLGMAIIGEREGNTVEWDFSSGHSQIQIKKVLYQPEASGDYSL